MEAGSELAGGSNLFWREVPVLLRPGERGEERIAQLTVRLIASGQQQGQRVRNWGARAVDRAQAGLDPLSGVLSPFARLKRT